MRGRDENNRLTMSSDKCPPKCTEPTLCADMLFVIPQLGGSLHPELIKGNW